MDSSADFLRHEPCPACRDQGEDRKGNNLGVWADGHKWCFKCGHYISGYKGISRADLKQQLEQQEKTKKNGSRIVHLPDDFTYTIPQEGIDWLNKYEITSKEVYDNRIGWTSQYRSMVFPVFDIHGNLLMRQSRYFGPNPKVQKYHTEGDAEQVFHLLGNGPDGARPIIVVEDLLSAIKVSRVMPCMPLWGSNLGIKRIRKLSDMFPKLIIWLDKDKEIYSFRARYRARAYFDEVSVIITDKDPKAYDDLNIELRILGTEA